MQVVQPSTCPKKQQETSRVKLFGHDQVLIFEKEKEARQISHRRHLTEANDNFNSFGRQLNPSGSKSFLRQVKVLPEIPTNRNQ